MTTVSHDLRVNGAGVVGHKAYREEREARFRLRAVGVVVGAVRPDLDGIGTGLGDRELVARTGHDGRVAVRLAVLVEPDGVAAGVRHRVPGSRGRAGGVARQGEALRRAESGPADGEGHRVAGGRRVGGRLRHRGGDGVGARVLRGLAAGAVAGAVCAGVGEGHVRALVGVAGHGGSDRLAVGHAVTGDLDAAWGHGDHPLGTPHLSTVPFVGRNNLYKDFFTNVLRRRCIGGLCSAGDYLTAPVPLVGHRLVILRGVVHRQGLPVHEFAADRGDVLKYRLVEGEGHGLLRGVQRVAAAVGDGEGQVLPDRELLLLGVIGQLERAVFLRSRRGERDLLAPSVRIGQDGGVLRQGVRAGVRLPFRDEGHGDGVPVLEVAVKTCLAADGQVPQLGVRLGHRDS